MREPIRGALFCCQKECHSQYKMLKYLMKDALHFAATFVFFFIMVLFLLERLKKAPQKIMVQSNL